MRPTPNVLGAGVVGGWELTEGMAVLDIRQRTGWLFMAVIVGHILLISAQVNTQRGVPVLEEVTFGTFAEVQRARDLGHCDGSRQLDQLCGAAGRARRERTSSRMRSPPCASDLQQERALAQQSRTLQGLLDLKSAVQLSTTAASVIAGGASPEFRTMTIDKGTGDGLASDMAVLAPAGVVGRIIMPTSARVESAAAHRP